MRRLPPALASACAMLVCVPVAGHATTPESPAASAASSERSAATAERRAEAGRQIAYAGFDGFPEWKTGAIQGLSVRKGRLQLGTGATQRRFEGRAYTQGTWNSPWVSPGFALTELIPSWSALTPGDSWIEVRVRGRDAAGRSSSWDVLGRWTSGDAHTQRRTLSGQDDDLGRVNVDTWQTASAAGVTSYQVRVALLRRTGGKGNPSIDAIGAVASRLPEGRVAVSTPAAARGTVLDVPQYSQMIHRGHYPQWGNGGQAWCSPTSTSMVLGYYDALPAPSSYRWVGSGHADPWVDYAARMTYDHAYRGTGNWAFNTAYAAPRAGKAFVTRLRSLREAEQFIAAGIPLVASISYPSGGLSGAPVGSSNGHLLVIVGFTREGDVVVNDPAASSNAGVRRTYDRAQFENAWLPTSGGTVYVVHDEAHPLPASPRGNW